MPEELADGWGLPLANLEADRFGHACELRDRRAQHIETVGAGEQRLPRLPLGHLRLEIAPLRFTHIGKIRQNEVESAIRGKHSLNELNPLCQPEPLRVGA